jgi:hypothetical protein
MARIKLAEAFSLMENVQAEDVEDVESETD